MTNQVYAPQDPMIGPIIHAIANIIRNQIPSVGYVYEQAPDGPPEDNTALIPLTQYKIMDDTNGKLAVKLTFGIRHFIRRGPYPDNILTAYSYFMPYMQAFAAWNNQTLNGLVRSISPSNGGVAQFVEAGQVFVVLVINLEVLTEFNIPTY